MFQQTHYAVVGGAIQGRNDVVVFDVYRDFTEVKLRLHMLKPWLWVMLPTIRKLDRGCVAVGMACPGRV